MFARFATTDVYVDREVKQCGVIMTVHSVRSTVFAMITGFVVCCVSIEESEHRHFTNDYLRGDSVPLHGDGILYEEIGLLTAGTPVTVGIRDDTCGRSVITGIFLQVDMRSTVCPDICRSVRASTLHERAGAIPYVAVMRGMGYDRIAQSPFLNAELHILHDGRVDVIPFWRVDVIRRRSEP